MTKQRDSKSTPLPPVSIVLHDVHVVVTLTNFANAMSIDGSISVLLTALRPFASTFSGDANPLLLSLQKEAGAGYSSTTSQLGRTLCNMAIAALSQVSALVQCPIELIGLITVHVNLFPKSTAALTCALRLNLLQLLVDYHFPAALHATICSLRQNMVDTATLHVAGDSTTLLDHMANINTRECSEPFDAQVRSLTSAVFEYASSHQSSVISRTHLDLLDDIPAHRGLESFFDTDLDVGFNSINDGTIQLKTVFNEQVRVDNIAHNHAVELAKSALPCSRRQSST